MFTQLFGYYLLNKGVITVSQFEEALAEKISTRVKIGALAIDAGYMTAAQVERVHEEQKRVDKRIGDIAISLGYLTNEQVKNLLAKQRTSNIVLGQTLIDKGYITNAVFESELAEYNKISKYDENAQSDKNLTEDIIKIYNLENDPEKKFHAEYLSLFVRNINRFIGDDFAFSTFVPDDDIIAEYAVVQRTSGGKSFLTAIYGDEKVFVAFASRYANEKLEVCDEYVCAVVGEFLNQQNGLYAVNESNLNDIEISMSSQEICRNKLFRRDKRRVVIPLSFSFGKIYIYLNKN